MDTAGSHTQHVLRSNPFDRRRSEAGVDDGDAGDTCRICRGERTADQTLFHPCKCSGSIRYVHQECLMEWLSHSQKKYCELCKTPFRFTKLYDQSMPDVLPVPLFLRQLALHGAKTLGKWLRYLVVILVWSCCLPWLIRHIWRGLFWLSDGTSVDPHDLLQLMSANTSLSAQMGSSNATLLASDPPAQTVSLLSSSSISVLLNLLTGDALLKGLLRLITSGPFTMSPLTTNVNGTSSPRFFQSQAPRHASLLSEMQSLNSFTRYAGANNLLIDILEGQIICLCVIATFILVFLIREWVINQQPVHLMPDPDQADVAPAQRPQQDDVRQAARRVRPHMAAVVGADAQADHGGLDIAQRPRAIPRQRRVAVTERAAQTQPGEGHNANIQFPTRSSSLQQVTPSGQTAGSSSAPGPIAEQPVAHEPALMPSDLQSPPLERGILDDAVSIRRTIEEQSNFAAPESVLHATFDEERREPDVLAHAGPATENSSRQDFDFLTLASRNDSREFTFTSSTGLEHSLISLDSSTSERPSSTSGVEIGAQSIEADTDVPSLESISSSELLSSAEPLDEQHSETQAVDVPGSETSAAAVPDLAADETEANEEARNMFGKIANWLWYTDAVVPPPQILDGLELDAAQAPGHAPIAQAQRVAPHPAPAPAPDRGQNAGHDANAEFGIDPNDPNAVEEQEELEGILELIGMEGPLVGMLQNIIFSVFLISLTLTISVWCPYIWGQVALSIMTHPVAICIKAPLTLLSRVANVLLDISLLLAGMLGLVLANATKATKYVAAMVFPSIEHWIKISAAEGLAITITQSSSIRLEKAFSVTLFSMRPKFPTYAMMTLHTLRTLKNAFSDVGRVVGNDLLETWLHAYGLWQSLGLLSVPIFIFRELVAFPQASVEAAKHSVIWLTQLSKDVVLPRDANDIDPSLMQPNTQDIIWTTIIGYGFFALSGSVYLKLARLFQGLRGEEKVEGFFADSFRQAGGVMKVIFIIGLEMLFFPLYCGCLFDVALLPLFKDATLATRWQFVTNAPITGFFVHWFIGTCYMFHFALFVSMCRKILRTGVLYFIRDPDDPTFHPVRDVLERPVLMQLGKIAFSAFVYGGLLLICLGGVIWTIAGIGGVFPIQWATNEPRLAFPIDVIFFNFLLPFVIRTAEPSKKISAMYSWWFKRCARILRLSHFLFGDERGDEMKTTFQLGFSPSSVSPTTMDAVAEPVDKKQLVQQDFDGYWVRAPASDAVRIPKGTKVFLKVDKDNNRLDGQTERSKGLHGKDDDRFAKIFIPSNFRLRVAIFIFLVWLFAASTGACITLGPLLVGRAALYMAVGSRFAPNDLYAFTVGIHLSGAAYLLSSHMKKNKTLSRASLTGIAVDLQGTALHLLRKAQYVVGMLYLVTTFGFVIPMLLSLLVELYVHLPIYGYLMASTTRHRSVSSTTTNGDEIIMTPTIHLAQSWTLGVLFLRLLLRASLRYPNNQTRLAHAVRAVVRDGPLQPDVRLASRALVLPCLVSSTVLLTLPLFLARCHFLLFGTAEQSKLMVYRLSYPMLLLTVLGVYAINNFWHKVESWQIKIRDEIYLVGERLHDFVDNEPTKVQVNNTNQDKGKGKSIEIVHTEEAEPSTQHESSTGLSSGIDGQSVELHHRNRLGDDGSQQTTD